MYGIAVFLLLSGKGSQAAQTMKVEITTVFLRSCFLKSDNRRDEMKKIKRKGLSWLLIMAMVLSGLALPQGQKAKAAETSYDLTVEKGQSPVTMAINDNRSDYIADVIFYVPDAAKEKSKLTASGSRIEITGKVNSISSDTGSLQAMIYTLDDSWNWNQTKQAVAVKAGQEFSLSYDLTQMVWKGSTLKKIGLRFVDNSVNTSTVSYTLASAKLIVGDSSSSGGSTGGSTGGTTEDGLAADAREDQSKYSAKLERAVDLGKGSWSDSWHEYCIKITNHTSSPVSKIQVVIPTSGELKAFQAWEISADYNKTVGGYIVYYSGEVPANDTVIVGNKFGYGPDSVTLGNPYVRAVNCNPPSGEGTESGKLNYKITGETKDIPHEQTPVGKHGKLHLKKVAGYGNAPVIVDQNDNPYQLRGASTHGLQWGDGNRFANKGTMQCLRDEWGVNLFRLAGYVKEGGYVNENGKAVIDSKIEECVEAARKLGMYVIIDWHVLDFNPNETKSQAITFFKTYAEKYKTYENVIFEICNEPTGTSWYNYGAGNDLYTYCKDVVKTIRDTGSDNLIVCGTNTYSQDVDEVARKPLDDKNTLYSIHFYAATHKDEIRQKVRTANAAGTPLFSTEFGICSANGNGSFDTASADTWIKLFDSMNISYTCWSLSNKSEAASYLKNSCNKTTGGYVESDLATTGIWLINTYRAHQDIEEETDTKVTPKPTSSVSATPTTAASEKPSTSPSAKPSATPSTSPSSKPSATPTTVASEKPSTSPSATPSTSPSSKPSATPTTAVSEKPSTSPSATPSTSPSSKPSATPTTAASEMPSASPSMTPSATPSTSPSSEPSAAPTTPAPTPGISPAPTPTPGTSPTPTPTPGGTTTPNPDTSSRPGTSPEPTNPTTSASATPSSSPLPGGTAAPSGNVTQTSSTDDSELTNSGSQSAKLRLAKKTLKIKKGKKKRIVIKVKTPGDKVKRYKVIGKKKIVKINAKGVVKAKRKGKVTIKVIMKSGATAKCRVIVKK